MTEQNQPADDGKIVVVGPDGMAVEPQSSEPDQDEESHRPLTHPGEQPRKAKRIGGMNKRQAR